MKPKLERYVDIIVDLDGNVTVEAFNFVGKSCEQETSFLLDAIGQVTSTRHKPEYYKNTSKVGLKEKVPICG